MIGYLKLEFTNGIKCLIIGVLWLSSILVPEVNIPLIGKIWRTKIMEAGTIVIEAPWNVDDVIEYMRKHCPDVEKDNDGQIILYTNLYEDTDRNLREL